MHYHTSRLPPDCRPKCAGEWCTWADDIDWVTWATHRMRHCHRLTIYYKSIDAKLIMIRSGAVHFKCLAITLRSSAFVSGVCWMGCCEPCCDPYELPCAGLAADCWLCIANWLGVSRADRSSTFTNAPSRTGGISTPFTLDIVNEIDLSIRIKDQLNETLISIEPHLIPCQLFSKCSALLLTFSAHFRWPLLLFLSRTFRK